MGSKVTIKVAFISKKLAFEIVSYDLKLINTVEGNVVQKLRGREIHMMEVQRNLLVVYIF